MITIKMMTSKKVQVMHNDKGDDKIVITQLTRSMSTSLVTHNKVKLTIAPPRKLASEHTHLLKTTRTQRLPISHHFGLFRGKGTKFSQ